MRQRDAIVARQAVPGTGFSSRGQLPVPRARNPQQSTLPLIVLILVKYRDLFNHASQLVVKAWPLIQSIQHIIQPNLSPIQPN